MAGIPIASADVWDLARRCSIVQGEVAAADLPRLAEQLADAAGALRFRLTGLTDDLGRPAGRLELDGAVRVICDRCGEALEVPIAERAQFYFVATEEELDRLPIDDAPAEPLLGSPRFDLAALVEEQAILALPISPRHVECALPADAAAGPAPEGETHRPFEKLAVLRKPGH